MKKVLFYLFIIFINYNIDAQVGSVQFSGAPSSDFFIDVEPGTRILRTRNWNTSAPNIPVTGIHTGTGQFEGNVTVAGSINTTGSINANGITAPLFRTTTWQPFGSLNDDFFLDIEPGTRILRTRNWNTTTPNVAATGIHTGSGVFESDLSVGNNLVINGKLGIGIKIPTKQLDIIGSAVNGDYTSLLRLGTNGAAYSNSGGGIEFAAFNNNGQINSVGVIAASLTDGTANYQTGNLRFLVSNSGVLKERMVLNSSGKLNITGNASNGNYTTLLRIGTDGAAYGGSGGGIEFAAFNNNGQINSVGVIAASLTDGTADHQTGDLRFLVSYSGSLQEKMRLSSSGNLDVNGTIHTKEVKVDLTGWSDFVFAPAYKLKPLTEIEQYIQSNGHLPEIPSAKEVEQNGVCIGDMQAKLLQKIEELTLYTIAQQKQIEQQRNEITELKKLNERIKALEEKNEHNSKLD